MSDSQLPLAGKTILVTRAAGQSSQFSKLLEAEGAIVLEMPALVIEPPSSWAALDEAIAHLDQFDWLILTSTNGVDYFLERLVAQGKTARDLEKVKIAVVGKKTSDRLQQHGISPHFIPPNFVADSLVETFPESPSGLKILFPRVETGGREVLVQELTAKGAIVTEVPAYQSCCAKTVSPEIRAALNAGAIDIITFASSKTVQCFHQILSSIKDDVFDLQPPIAKRSEGLPDPRSRSAPKDSPIPNPQPPIPNPQSPIPTIASIGPQTSATCIERFGRVEIEAEEYTLEGLTYAIVGWAKVSQRTV